MTTISAATDISAAAANPAPSSVSQRTPSAERQKPIVAAAPTSAAVPPPVQPKEIAQRLEQVQQAIERLKQSIKPELGNTLDFQIDQSSGRTVVKVMDTETNTLIRQIPSEEVLAITHAIDQTQGRGGLIKQKV